MYSSQLTLLHTDWGEDNISVIIQVSSIIILQSKYIYKSDFENILTSSAKSVLVAFSTEIWSHVPAASLRVCVHIINPEWVHWDWLPCELQ